MRKKHIRLPNGYGQIRKLTGKRRNPYGVYPPQTEEDENGRRKPVKALCYVPSWTVGFAVLTAYKAGKYVPGMEHELTDAGDLDAILADYIRVRRSMLNQPDDINPTFAEVYEEFFREKYETGKQLSQQSMNSTRAAYKNCSALHDKKFRDLRLSDLQSVVDSCPLKYTSTMLIVSLIKQMYRYAEANEIVEKDIGKHVVCKKQTDAEHGVPFTEDELKTLWNHSDDPTVELILIMCFAGYRINAYKTLEVNLDDRYFLGGNKTKAGRDLMIPIHSGIYDLVERRISRDGSLLCVSYATFTKSMYEALEALGIEKHTPHDCKHTFSALCERYGVNENDRKRMLGHSVGNITNDVYGHRTLEDLRNEIEKIHCEKPICQKRENDLSKACQKRD